MIYGKNGDALTSAYNASGDSIENAYDVGGEVVFTAQSQILKVMTYNVGGWYLGRGGNVPSAEKALFYDLQTGMIENNDPDVLVIQEYLANFSDDGTSALTMLQGLFPYVHAKVSGTYFGRTICSKYPITNYVERTYTQESSRYFDSCTITVNGVPITFVNTHLGLTQANRNPEIDQLITYLSTLDKFILCGDFNTEMIYETAGVSNQQYIDNVKPFIDAGFNSANFADFGFMMTCINWTNGNHLCLDNIYTSSDIAVSDAFVDETKLSELTEDKVDHMPLIATLTI